MEINTIKEARDLIKSGVDISTGEYDFENVIADCYDQLTFNTNCLPFNYGNTSMYIQVEKKFKSYLVIYSKHAVSLAIILTVNFSIYDYDPMEFDFSLDNRDIVEMRVDYSIGDDRFLSAEPYKTGNVNQNIINYISMFIDDKIQLRMR